MLSMLSEWGIILVSFPRFCTHVGTPAVKLFKGVRPSSTVISGLRRGKMKPCGMETQHLNFYGLEDDVDFGKAPLQGLS